MIKEHKKADIILENIHGEAKIYYDELGIPNIKASNQLMAGFSLGYAQAADRLWQMHMSRMIAQGRLSEMLGELPMNFDKSMRLLYTRGTLARLLFKI